MSLSCELRVKHAFPYYVLLLFILDIRARVLCCDLTFFLETLFFYFGAFFPTPPFKKGKKDGGLSGRDQAFADKKGGLSKREMKREHVATWTHTQVCR